MVSVPRSSRVRGATKTIFSSGYFLVLVALIIFRVQLTSPAKKRVGVVSSANSILPVSSTSAIFSGADDFKLTESGTGSNTINSSHSKLLFNHVDHHQVHMKSESATSLVGMALPQSEAESRTPRRSILLVGDSLTQRGCESPHGWGNALIRRFIRFADVFCRGNGGYNTKWVDEKKFEMLDADGLGMANPAGNPKPPNYLFITLWLGANDACLPYTERTGWEEAKKKDPTRPQFTRVHVPLDEFERHLLSIGTAVLERTDLLLLFTPGPVDEDMRAAAVANWPLEPQGTSHTNAAMKQYVEVVKKVGNNLRENHLKRNVGSLNTGGSDGDVDHVVDGGSRGRKNGGENRLVQKEVVVIDIYELLFEKRADVLHDGLHFNELGESLISKEVLKILGERGLDCEHQKCPLQPLFPFWSDTKALQPAMED